MVNSAQVTVSTTALQVSGDNATREYFIRAHPDNTGDIALGGVGVTMSTGLLLTKNDDPIVLLCRLCDLYVIGENTSDKLCWLVTMH